MGEKILGLTPISVGVRDQILARDKYLVKLVGRSITFEMVDEPQLERSHHDLKRKQH